MAPFQGFFTLKTPNDLYQKLCRELGQLIASPTSEDAAFNFFVTAEHLLDWLYPESPGQRELVRRGSVLLQVCSHVANGAKHFRATAKHHTSVRDAVVSAAGFQADAFQADAFQTTTWLVVELDGDAARELGPTIEVTDLARRVLTFWTNLMESNQGATNG